MNLREKIKVLFATTNPAKINKYREALNKRGIEVLTLTDLGIDIKVEENGKNALENSYLKAKGYYEASKMITIGMDNSLFVEELPADKQPGTHVKRINGKELNDDEMIEYYTKLVDEYGGKLTAKWVYGMTVYNGEKEKQYSWTKDHFYFVNKPCEKRNLGYPLDSISIIPEFNKYLSELTQEEKSKHTEKQPVDGVIDFIINAINDLK